MWARISKHDAIEKAFPTSSSETTWLRRDLHADTISVIGVPVTIGKADCWKHLKHKINLSDANIHNRNLQKQIHHIF